MPVIHAEAVTAAVQSAATLWAAVIAGGAALLSAVLSAVAAHRSGRWTQREQWWQRFTWACEKCISREPGASEVGASVLDALIGVPWASAADHEMALAMSNVIVDHVREPAAPTGVVGRRNRRRWWPA
ncbi:hypothetical protein BFL35_13965 [Clavibacter michiganensis]|nr:hypothetical protein BFL35_13965 [Clavibacter michiganensis]